MILRRKLFIIFTLIWMAFIFSFSSRSGDVSSQDSNHVGMIIGEVFIPGFEQWNDTKQDDFADAIDHICGSWIFDSWDFRRRKEILEMENGSSVADRCRIRGDR